MSAPPFGVAILGCAHGHARMYAEVWRRTPRLGVRPLMVWDRQEDRAKAFAEPLGLPTAPSLEAALHHTGVEGVVIASETAFHAELVERAADAGKAIVLQKPVALTLADADRIVAAVARRGIRFTMAWQMRADPQNLRMKALVEEGVLGRIFLVRRRHCLNAHRWPGFESSWHLQPELNCDFFADDASHPIDFIYWLMGMPSHVIAELSSLRSPAIRHDNAVVLFCYGDGRLAEVSCTFVAPAGELTTEIVGEHGLLIQQYGDLVSAATPRMRGGVSLRWIREGDAAWTIEVRRGVRHHGDRISGLAASLADFFHGRRLPLATAGEGRDVLRLTLACYESAESGRRVCLNPSTSQKEI